MEKTHCHRYYKILAVVKGKFFSIFIGSFVVISKVVQVDLQAELYLYLISPPILYARTRTHATEEFGFFKFVRKSYLGRNWQYSTFFSMGFTHELKTVLNVQNTRLRKQITCNNSFPDSLTHIRVRTQVPIAKMYEQITSVCLFASGQPRYMKYSDRQTDPKGISLRWAPSSHGEIEERSFRLSWISLIY